VSGILCNVLVAWLVAKVPTQWIICIGLLSTGYVVSLPIQFRLHKQHSDETDTQSGQCLVRNLSSRCDILENAIQRHVDGSPRCRFVRPPSLVASDADK